MPRCVNTKTPPDWASDRARSALMSVPGGQAVPVSEAVPGEPRQPHRHLPPPASDLSAQKIVYSLNHEAFLGYTD
jgi:hypothetical protein